VVKGRGEAISVYEVLDGEPENVMNWKLATQAHFEKGMRHYQAKRWNDAQFHFLEVLSAFPEDKAAELYLERVRQYAKEGVPESWEGVTILAEK
jgi:adenylate cyclase